MKRPNVIVVTTDQQRCDSLSCYSPSASFTSTPHIDRLAAEGVVCDRAYTPNPVCTPARASLFSGQYVSRHGAWNVGMNVPEETTMLSHRLGHLGYQTHYIGKAHFQAYQGQEASRESLDGWAQRFANWDGPYYGFDKVELCLAHTINGIAGHYGLWVKEQAGGSGDDELARLRAARPLTEGAKFGGRALDWDLPVALHNSVWTAERSIDFLKTRDRNTPFFLAIGFQDPHHAHALPTDFEDRVDAADVPLPRFETGELEDKPPHFGLAHRGEIEQSEFRGDFPIAGQGASAGDSRAVSEVDARQGRAYYYSMVKLIDQQMGRILQCLDEEDLTDDTIVVFTTDHGELLGDHGLWMKGPFHYEELVRIPLIVRWPKGFPGGRRVNGLCSLVDITPTILAAIGEEIGEAECDGADVMPLLRGDSDAVCDHVIVECTDDPRGLRLKTVVTKNRKLTHYHGHEFGELYDLDDDPGELVNRWNDATYQEDKQKLMATLIDHAERLERRVERLSYA